MDVKIDEFQSIELDQQDEEEADETVMKKKMNMMTKLRIVFI